VKRKQLFAIGISLLLTFGQTIYVGATEDGEESGIVVSTEESDVEAPVTSENDVPADPDEYDMPGAKTEECDEEFSNYGYIAEDFIAPSRSTDYDCELVFAASYYDESYNSYKAGLLPKTVRNQAKEGTCWAHAVLGAVETDMIVNNGATNDIDYSELQMVYFTAHDYDDPKDCHDADTVSFYSSEGKSYMSNGGNSMFAYHALLNQIGPIDEQLGKYEWGATYAFDEAYLHDYNCAQLEQVQIIPTSDIEGIKQAVLDHGSVAVSYFGASATGKNGNVNCFVNSSEEYVVTYYSTASSTNHAVMIVGWDDNIPADSFGDDTHRPSRNGGWLIRNSWGGQGYGITGYFWLSYDEPSLKATGNAYAMSTSTLAHDHVYSYEGNMPGHAFFTNDPYNKQFCAVEVDYDIDAGEVITTIGFEIGSCDVHAKATVTAGDKVATGSIDTEYSGFYMIELDNPIYVTEDTTVRIRMDYTSNVQNGTTCIVGEFQSNYGENNYSFDFGSSATHLTLTYTHEAKNQRIFTTDGTAYRVSSDLSVRVYTDDYGMKAVVDNVNVALDEYIGLNLYASLYNYTPEELDGAYAIITDGKEYVRVELKDCIVSGGNGRKNSYKIPLRVAAKDMDVTYTTEVYDSDGKVIGFTNSNATDTNGFEYSINNYLRILSKDSDKNTALIAETMLAYGQWAACYFGKKEYADIEKDLTAFIGAEGYAALVNDFDTVSASDVAKYTKAVTGSTDGIVYIGTSVILESKTVIRHYFYTEENIMDYSFVLDGEKKVLNAESAGGGIYFVDINEIPVNGYRNGYSVSVNNGLVINYSVNGYIADAMSRDTFRDGSNVTFDELVILLYWYGEMIYNYRNAS